MIEHRRIEVKGIVQGVGFRPFVYSLASKFNLKGQVCNASEGVLMELEGRSEDLSQFTKTLTLEPPPLAEIEEVIVNQGETKGYTSFEIIHSKGATEANTKISPDMATCPDCIADIKDSNNYRFNYPFTNCTNCGPRFTIIHGVPYDRAKTTMSLFNMCNKCSEEYQNISNRRFHAQPIACSSCGPSVSVLDKDGKELGVEDPLEFIRQVLLDGSICAIKGLGGYHLACDPLNNSVVNELRRRKIREEKPLAIMVRDIKVAREIGSLEPFHEDALLQPSAPIVLVPKGTRELAYLIAPENPFIGIMLPYTPLHHLLFNDLLDCLVMTSGNMSGEPIYYQDREAIENLAGIADYFLTHNREIHRYVDDSVVHSFNGKPYPFRRSRGFAPKAITLPTSGIDILAVGGEQKNVFCIVKGKSAFLSHHIGDLENLPTLTAFEKGINDFKELFAIEPQLIAYDLHPEYLSTKYALEQPGPKIGIQHHEAHIAACMVDNKLNEPVIGVAFDGTGYGWDHKLWGGEFFVGDFSGFKRMAHLKYLPLPGGVKAIREPWRMASVYLNQVTEKETSNYVRKLFGADALAQWKVLEPMLGSSFFPLTSSAGRLFDAISALLGVRTTVTYEGQAAVELELLARRGNSVHQLPYKLQQDAELPWILDFSTTITRLLELCPSHNKADIALSFHNLISEAISDIVERISEETSITKVCLSGGVFQNILLMELLVPNLKNRGLQVFWHNQVPPNDGGIALGQAMIAQERSSKKCV